jgi:oligopeptide transport system substrate-binding protein
VPENKIVNALFEGLVAEGPTGSDTVGGVAERWEITPDGRVYTFFLRTTAKWSNGDPITAQDFIASYRRMLTPSLGADDVVEFVGIFGARCPHAADHPEAPRPVSHRGDETLLVVSGAHPDGGEIWRAGAQGLGVDAAGKPRGQRAVCAEGVAAEPAHRHEPVGDLLGP